MSLVAAKLGKKVALESTRMIGRPTKAWVLLERRQVTGTDPRRGAYALGYW
jgi:hypothetical protein